MIPVLISQQSNRALHEEQHDCLDQRWYELALKAGILLIPVPNHPELIEPLWLSTGCQGVILSGGGEFSHSPDDRRSRCEELLVALANKHKTPILGICRGMQVLLQLAGEPLVKVSGHVQRSMTISVNNQPTELNSYHNLATYQAPSPYRVWAQAQDGVVKAIEHPENKQVGIMWHPERMVPFDSANVQFLHRLFVTQEYPCAHLF
ncbi:gamma-glutamyl-gamma-aminobutyrate hydrolase family protein [Aliagarivorans marinus]|uniref:gamma-glutamyl-gamma-aminobutyrate hydrolase family protein n=1 Tax=Aliagarivorans marinus TaxID=561965 RepID=UPI0006864FA1|nr:gamma-glutamyl-gamma-aminobutyrate hydrolase family protein [Aliagarivorans marinus]